MQSSPEIALLHSDDPFLFDDVCVGAGGPIASHAGSVLPSQSVHTDPAEVTVWQDGAFLLVLVGGGVVVVGGGATTRLDEGLLLLLVIARLAVLVDETLDTLPLDVLFPDALVLVEETLDTLPLDVLFPDALVLCVAVLVVVESAVLETELLMTELLLVGPELV